jgi:hypothetical protein
MNGMRTAKMTSIFNAFLSGGLDTFWTHFFLLGGSISAEFAVAAGIILESPKEKACEKRLECGLCLAVF